MFAAPQAVGHAAIGPATAATIPAAACTGGELSGTAQAWSWRPWRPAQARAVFRFEPFPIPVMKPQGWGAEKLATWALVGYMTRDWPGFCLSDPLTQHDHREPLIDNFPVISMMERWPSG